MQLPDTNGFFGRFGGRFVPETVIPALEELADQYAATRNDPEFQDWLSSLLRDYAGRPSPIFHARRLTTAWGGARVYLKREDLNHTGSHKINNCLGQALLARQLGKPRMVAETGAGQHGVATATACALFGLECVVYMGSTDMERQRFNVERMQLLGARVEAVDSGSKTLKDAINQAIRDWVTNVHSTHYLIGSVVGPHPYPLMVRDFQRVIGQETRRQILDAEGRLPDAVVACVGGGSNALGIFHPFLEEPTVQLVGVEAYGRGTGPGTHAATLGYGKPGVLHGALSYLLQDGHGQVLETRSVSAGLDYPGVGPEHSHLKETGRVSYTGAADGDAEEAFFELSRLEGIIPALESCHALAHARNMARDLGPHALLVVNLSGRGDKDLPAMIGPQEEEQLDAAL